MTKLKTFLEKYQPNTKDEAKFIDKHTVDKKEDRNGNGDDVFAASNVKKYDRKKNRQGYEPSEDEKMYESVEELIEKNLRPGQKISRQELTKLILKANPHLDPVHAHALAVATVSRVDEELLDELSDNTLKSYAHKASNDRTKHLGDEHKYNKRLKGVSKAVEKMSNEEVEELSERNDDNKLKKDIFTVNKGKEFMKKGINFAKYDAHKLADKRDNDYGIHYPDSYSDDYDSADEKYASRKTALRTLKTVGRKAMAENTELEEAASPITGTRLVSKHEGKDGYHVEVRHNKDWDEWQVHHYHNGKHLGEGPVSYHDDKADAKETAEWCIKNNCVKNGKVLKEEVDQLDEISKETLASYANKSGDELDKAMATLNQTGVSTKKFVKALDTLTKRDKGYRAAVRRLTKKDTEQLDEISKQTLGRYVKSAMLDKDASNRQAKALSNLGHDYKQTGDNEKASDMFQKAGWEAHRAANRTTGIYKAINKLTKEDIINNAIKTYLPEGPTSPEDIFENRVSILPENHQALLEGLFENLNDTNKLAMLDKMSTEDGLNELLDFAIQARNV